jgi:hypothetical protein
MKTTPLWMRFAKRVENSRRAQFMGEIEAAHRLNCRSYSNPPCIFDSRHGRFLGESMGFSGRYWRAAAGQSSRKASEFEGGRLLGRELRRKFAPRATSV